MFDYISSPARYGLIVLWGIWAFFLFGGFIFGHESKTHRIPRKARMASSVTLAVAGWSWYILTSATDAQAYALFIAIGMSLGLLGDLILADVLPGGRNVLGGIGAFGLGHVFYIAAIIRYGNTTGLNDPQTRWGALLVWLFIAVLGWYFVVFRGQKGTVLHWAALPYALLLASTAGLGMGLALQSSLFIGLAVGAGLFLFSDLVLAAELFNGLQFNSIGDLIWLTYGPGQMLIVYSIGAAIQFVM